MGLHQWGDEYESAYFKPNQVLSEKYPQAFTMDDFFDTNDDGTLGIKAIVVINVLCFLCCFAIFVGIAYYIYRTKQKEHECQINQLNLQINNKQQQNGQKPPKDKIGKQDKNGIQMAGYKEMESSRESDLSDIESGQHSTDYSNNQNQNKISQQTV